MLGNRLYILFDNGLYQFQLLFAKIGNNFITSKSFIPFLR